VRALIQINCLTRADGYDRNVRLIRCEDEIKRLRRDAHIMDLKVLPSDDDRSSSP
jgi:hypothetical protein